MDIVKRRAIDERQRGIAKPDVLLQRRATGGVVLGDDVAEAIPDEVRGRCR